MKKTIGVIGGGQLCRMMGEEIVRKQLPFELIALDPAPECPAFPFLKRQLQGDFKDPHAIGALADLSDVMTYEIELAGVEMLHELELAGKAVHPSSETLRIIQDKLRQANFLQSRSLPVPDSVGFTNQKELEAILTDFGLPVMIKARRDSYDGRGNFLLRSRDEIPELMDQFHGRELMAQRFVNFKMEVSVIAARSTSGEIRTWPVAENIHQHSILHTTLMPARIGRETSERARHIASEVLDSLKGAGVFGVEMFVTGPGEIMINEIAPRVHNSGHVTIEACHTSQFEQHLRAITGMPLGETGMMYEGFALMQNILGDTDGELSGPGPEWAEFLAKGNAQLHWYGKKEVRMGRKMGHFTFLDTKGSITAEEMIRKAEKLRAGLRFEQG